MNHSVFVQLINDPLLPELHPNAAATLLEVDKNINPGLIDGGELSPLQTRCVEAVAKDWQACNRPGRDLSRLCPFLLSKVLTRSLEVAKAAKLEQERVIHGLIFSIHRITISGAINIPEVNGVYILGGAHYTDDEGKEWNSFAKDGMDEGEEDVFEIWCVAKHNDPGTYIWQIEAKNDGSELYKAEIPSLAPPPEQGWKWKGPNGWTDAPDLRCTWR